MQPVPSDGASVAFLSELDHPGATLATVATVALPVVAVGVVMHTFDAESSTVLEKPHPDLNGLVASVFGFRVAHVDRPACGVDGQFAFGWAGQDWSVVEPAVESETPGFVE